MNLTVLQEVVGDLKDIVDPLEVVHACDISEISRHGYLAIYNVILNALCSHGLMSPLLPRPQHIMLARKDYNFDVQDLLGNILHISDTMQLCNGQPTKITR